MGIAANKFRMLFLTRNKSDIEYKIMILNQRRIALMDESQRLATDLSNNIFQTGNNSDNYGGNIPGVLPGFVWDPSYEDQLGVDAPDSDPIPTGDLEEQLAIIQSMDKELEVEGQMLQVLHKSAETEVDSVKKVLQKNVEKDYKTFG